jgi:8-oxo-dGTP diphosphatase
VQALAPITVPLRTEAFAFDQDQLHIYETRKEIETFRFIDWDNFSAASVTLPIDKVVADLVKGSK